MYLGCLTRICVVKLCPIAAFHQEKVPLAAVWRTDYRGKGGSKGTSEEATSAVQMSDEGGGSDDGSKWLDSGCILKVGLAGFAEGGCEECFRERSQG